MILAIRDYIDEHLYESHSVQDICRKFNINREKLQAGFRELTQTTLHAYIIHQRMERAAQQFSLAAAALDAMSPLKVLERGYAIARDAQGHVVREASMLTVGDAVRLRLWKGAIDCRVEGTENE